MINPNATDTLSLGERAALEARYDGPITEQAIADHRAQSRGALAPKTLDRLLTEVRFMVNERKFYQTEVDRLDQERMGLLADREGLYAGEYDRMTRHAAYLERQKRFPQDTVDSYTKGIVDAEKQIAVMMQQAAE